MNKFLLNISAFTILFLTACETSVNYEGVESAGKRLGSEDNELYGNAYVLGSDKSVDTVMEAVEAYNALMPKKKCLSIQMNTLLKKEWLV